MVRFLVFLCGHESLWDGPSPWPRVLLGWSISSPPYCVYSRGLESGDCMTQYLSPQRHQYWAGFNVLLQRVIIWLKKNRVQASAGHIQNLPRNAAATLTFCLKPWRFHLAEVLAAADIQVYLCSFDYELCGKESDVFVFPQVKSLELWLTAQCLIHECCCQLRGRRSCH